MSGINFRPALLSVALIKVQRLAFLIRIITVEIQQMWRHRILAALALLCILCAGCKKKTPPAAGEPAVEPKSVPQPKAAEAPRAGALLPDKEYADGQVSAAVIHLQTRVDQGGAPSGTQSEEVKKARQESAEYQVITVSEDRGKLVFATDDYYIPRGTELRYNPADDGRYVLADPRKSQYWVMSGGELGNLLEGGPSVARSGYTIDIKAPQEQAEAIAGVKVSKTDARITFDWSLKTKSGDKSGKVVVALAIWHSADAKLKHRWGQMMVDFLTVPFQDDSGRQVVHKLKQQIKFPLKWSMQVSNKRQGKDPGDDNLKLVSTATKLEVLDVPRKELASPPAAFAAALGPYEFGDGGQTVDPAILAKLPATKGAPPKNIEPETK